MSFALIIDVGLMYHAKTKGENLLKLAKKENLNIEDYFKINDVKITNIEKNKQNNCTLINTRIDSVFGNLIGYKTYDIEITDC
jgi:hypothetical protein